MGCKIGPRQSQNAPDEAITQVDALIDFRQNNPDRSRGEEVRGSHGHCGGDRDKVEEQRPHPKKLIPLCPIARSLDIMTTWRER